jgi:taurine dioxygenase
MSDSTARWQVRRLAPALGAEVSGVDLTDQSSATIERLQQLLLEHLVLFVPGQNLSVEEHVALGRQFGELEGECQKLCV